MPPICFPGPPDLAARYVAAADANATEAIDGDTAERFQNAPGLPRQALEEIGDLHGSPGCGLVFELEAVRPAAVETARACPPAGARPPHLGEIPGEDRLLHA